MKVGRRLANKVLNAARFALAAQLPAGAKVTEAIDVAMLAKLKELIVTATEAFEKYDHTKALEATESLFWTFTDDYVELVKDRFYGQGETPIEQQASAVLTLRIATGVFLRLFAPFVPFAAEEAWSWWQQGSVHLASWPSEQELSEFEGSGLLDLASEALIQVRKAKSDLKLSMKAEIESASLSGPAELASFKSDLMAMGKIHNLNLVLSDQVLLSDAVFITTQES